MKDGEVVVLKVSRTREWIDHATAPISVQKFEGEDLANEYQERARTGRLREGWRLEKLTFDNSRQVIRGTATWVLAHL